ncbi:glutathione S-transferase family protein [Aureimonas sp. ME7]|uniref:glutathione S-transferase family protein n=1 Tax=Aureimonas sp. ME7 TaxID=2744252 RepID=UPI0015F4B840|nr:glutathione S-transferase family protein [Aureimonas sp. ME7]
MSQKLKLFHNPRSRAVTAHWMLEEARADYELVPIAFDPAGARDPALLAVNPMGKIPTLVLPDGTVVTETAAILAWVADAYPQADLAPAPGSPERGTYYRWLFFCGSCFEPALIERMMRADAPPLPKGMAGWGSYDDVIDTLEGTIAKDYLVGDRFSAADLYVGAQLWWATTFKAPRVADNPAIQAYVGRLTERPAFRRVTGG